MSFISIENDYNIFKTLAAFAYNWIVSESIENKTRKLVINNI
ncbi:hypothetical protein PAUR_a1840 [Pseudoalteromonas aurantia 208]|uniref:Uncharacterized protein n=1 Tax=Pseudoalteromonas aurantia 208 TaxID=1314867 RepID=A0ABR9EBB9_9GAMM|nr:hypothetical protein [Pseudoalteromonas aurantia 208]